MTGILYIVFGEDHDKMAAHCVAYSRKFTNLPIQVLTNLKERDVKWSEVDNIEFTYFDLPTSENRAIKTTANLYSKFDNTIMLDCDSIVQHSVFDSLMSYYLERADLVLNLYDVYPLEVNGKKRFQKIYLRAYNQFNCSGNLNVYNGAIILFKKGALNDSFFETWHKMWEEFGKHKEMPVLACAVQKYKGKVDSLPHGVFAPDSLIPNAVIQHNPNKIEFWNKIGIKPFELKVTSSPNVDDYSFVDWEKV